jgi:hypothetical protein
MEEISNKLERILPIRTKKINAKASAISRTDKFKCVPPIKMQNKNQHSFLHSLGPRCWSEIRAQNVISVKERKKLVTGNNWRRKWSREREN